MTRNSISQTQDNRRDRFATAAGAALDAALRRCRLTGHGRPALLVSRPPAR
ncbi:MAG: hypothetical protein U1E25_02130 [Methylocystis sp.]